MFLIIIPSLIQIHRFVCVPLPMHLPFWIFFFFCNFFFLVDVSKQTLSLYYPIMWFTILNNDDNGIFEFILNPFVWLNHHWIGRWKNYVEVWMVDCWVLGIGPFIFFVHFIFRRFHFIGFGFVCEWVKRFGLMLNTIKSILYSVIWVWVWAIWEMKRWSSDSQNCPKKWKIIRNLKLQFDQKFIFRHQIYRIDRRLRVWTSGKRRI